MKLLEGSLVRRIIDFSQRFSVYKNLGFIFLPSSFCSSFLCYNSGPICTTTWIVHTELYVICQDTEYIPKSCTLRMSTFSFLLLNLVVLMTLNYLPVVQCLAQPLSEELFLIAHGSKYRDSQLDKWKTLKHSKFLWVQGNLLNRKQKDFFFGPMRWKIPRKKGLLIIEELVQIDIRESVSSIHRACTGLN